MSRETYSIANGKTRHRAILIIIGLSLLVADLFLFLLLVYAGASIRAM